MVEIVRLAHQQASKFIMVHVDCWYTAYDVESKSSKYYKVPKGTMYKVDSHEVDEDGIYYVWARPLEHKRAGFFQLSQSTYTNVGNQ